MQISTDELEEQMFKTKDLIRTLCDTAYISMKEQKPMHHIATLCPIIFEQFTITEQLLEQYLHQCQARG